MYKFIHIINICACLHAKLLQSCLTLCNPMDCSPPGTSVHEILQARILEWVAISFSRGSSRPRDRTNLGLPHCRQMHYYLSHQGSPCYMGGTLKYQYPVAATIFFCSCRKYLLQILVCMIQWREHRCLSWLGYGISYVI